jgi:hypothetical protein
MGDENENDLRAQLAAVTVALEQLNDRLARQVAAAAPVPPEPKLLLTLVAAAKRIGIDRRTLAKEIDKGVVGTVLVGKSRFVPLAEVEAFARPARRVSARAGKPSKVQQAARARAASVGGEAERARALLKGL